MSSALIPMAHEHISAPTVVPSPTMPLPGSVGHILHGHLKTIDSSPLFTTSQFLSYCNFSNTIVH